MNIKKIFKLFVAGLAASLMLVSCAKQDAMDDGCAAGGARVIAVSFASNSTKTTLDGFQPKFVEGDVIKVSDGTTAVDCEVEVDGSGKASITTSLTGALTMVYPSTAAKMNGNAIDGILVPTVQDGTFASANICKAEIPADATSATFENQTAVFKITPGAGANTKYVEVIAQKDFDIANDVPAASTYTCLHKIHVASASADPVYVSILVPESLKISNLGFADGYNIKGLKDDFTVVSSNTIYTVTGENWNRPYVEIAGLKWSTMNVGATTVAGSPSTCYGDYFAWGETEPYYNSMSITSASAATFTWKDGKGGGYGWPSYCNGSSEFIEWNPIPYDATSHNLTSSYDVATHKWGSSWRTPTIAELQSLVTVCGSSNPTNLASSTPGCGVYIISPTQSYLPTYRGVTGLLFVDDSIPANMVFLHFAGLVLDTSFKFGDLYGGYWSSSISNVHPSRAQSIYFNFGSIVPPEFYYRHIGLPVRPVSD